MVFFGPGRKDLCCIAITNKTRRLHEQKATELSKEEGYVV